MLKVNNLTKVFNKDTTNEKVALNKVSVDIHDGDFITVIGGNGSGKTTFLNLISGVYIPDQGTIEINGNNVTNLVEHKRAKFLGRVFQDPMQGTAANMSILENMSIAYQKGQRKTLKWGFKKQNNQIFKEKLATLNLSLENNIEQKMGLLSGGQRQAITLIMATLNKPKLLLLDEHTAALDPKTAKTVLELTNEMIQKEKITTIMITHNMRDALKYGNRLLMFNKGEIIFDVNGKEKEALTIEALLKKFETNEEIELSDSMILA